MIVTKEELTAYTGVEFEAGNDVATLLIKSAQDISENYLGYSIEEKNYEKHFSLDNSKIIKTGIKNVSEVTELKIDGVAVTDYYIEDDKVILLEPVSSDNIIIKFTAGFDADTLPSIIKLTVLRIAALLQEESNSNIGLTSKSFVDGSRTFVNYQNYDKFLVIISKYKII